MKKIFAYLAKNPITTCMGITAGVCQGLVYVPFLEPYKWVIMGVAGIASSLIGIFASDS